MHQFFDHFGKPPQPGTYPTILITALITALVTFIIEKAGAVILSWITKPFLLAWELLYHWLAPRNVFSIALRSYYSHLLRSDLTRIENPIGPTLDVPLETAFAPLKLLSTGSQEPIELFSYAAANCGLIVLGGPGTGKTTLMKSLVVSIAKRSCHPQLNQLTPVFITLRKLAKANHDVTKAIIAALADFHYPQADRFVKSAAEQGRFFIVLDGLDEVGAARSDVAARIQEFCRWNSLLDTPNHVIVTCREASYRTEDLREVLPAVVRVEPFSNHHMKIFLMGWPEYKGRIAAQLYSQIQRDPQIRDICRNPLLLTILAGLYLETEQFELPSSRERFYNATVRELLVNRPVRRNMQTNFGFEDKRRILERVALLRLEGEDTKQDPEEILFDVIGEEAKNVISSTVHIESLVRELVETHGIIKKTREGAYVFSHRTIQEYFAASESSRTRRSGQVVRIALDRREFTEVLIFYCGLNRNIEILDSVLADLADAGEWPLAGRCLLNMTEVPSAALIDRVAEGLLLAVQNDAPDTQLCLEILVSLSHRTAPAFERTRVSVQNGIESLLASYGKQGLASLCSALSSNPETAMRLMPALLAHRDREWRAAGYRLLRDIGTPESLDQLVQSLDPRNPDRGEAAKQLASLLPKQRKELTDRIRFLPPRVDPMVWPLDQVFPATIALALAEALIQQESTGLLPLDYAIKALRMKAGAEAPDSKFLRRWESLPRDVRVSRARDWCSQRARTFFRTFYSLGLCVGWLTFFTILLIVETSDREYIGFFMVVSIICLALNCFRGVRSFFFWLCLVEAATTLSILAFNFSEPEATVEVLSAAGLIVLILAPFIVPRLLQRLRWPNNPLLPAADQLLAPQLPIPTTTLQSAQAA